MDNLTRFHFPVTLVIEATDYDKARDWFGENMPTLSGDTSYQAEGIGSVAALVGLSDDALESSDVLTYTRADGIVTRYDRADEVMRDGHGVIAWVDEGEVNLIDKAKLAAGQAGQTMAEYAVILAVVCVITVGAITALAGGIGNAIDSVTGILPGGEG